MQSQRSRRTFARGHGRIAVLLATVGLSAIACKRYDPPAGRTTALYASCCGGAGMCLPEALIEPGDAERLARDDCGDALLCVPNEAAGGGRYVPERCESLLGFEGRCLPSCLPELEDELERLPSDGCPEAHVCAPCYDPISLEDTGACNLGDDPGPSDPPPEVERCCNEIGRCIDTELLRDSEQSRLGRDSCGTESLCVPERWLEQPVVPMSCRAVGDAEGRCLPACLPEIAERSEDLMASGCPAEHLCAPCYDLLSGESTGACEIGDDPGPSDPPEVLGRCCGDLGRCVPRSLVPEGDEERLGADACTDDDALCVPEVWLEDGPLVPESCRAPGDLEGRCLPACLPEIAERADQLEVASCPAGHLCAPCFDPLDGESTRACELGDDPGPSEPPVTFGNCCQDRGRCVPRSLVVELASESDADQLGTDACAEGEDELCVPSDWLPAGLEAAPVSCRSWADGEGRCLPDCLPGLDPAELPVGDCASGELCAPCFDPLSGEPTAACGLGPDPGPSEPAVTFADCCESDGEVLGRCLPVPLLSSEDADRLPADSCDADSERCVPNFLIDDPDAAFEGCRAAFEDGACIPGCMLSRSAYSILSQRTCPDGMRCAPCSQLADEGIDCP